MVNVYRCPIIRAREKVQCVHDENADEELREFDAHACIATIRRPKVSELSYQSQTGAEQE
jgi:hypothetical protein